MTQIIFIQQHCPNAYYNSLKHRKSEYDAQKAAKKQADDKYKAEIGDNFFERAGKVIAKNVTKAAVTLQECFATNKCQLDTPLPWRFCNEEHMIDGAPALTVGSVCPCKFGGIISIIDTPEPSQRRRCQNRRLKR